MAERNWFKDATVRAVRGEMWQLTFWGQREAKRCMCEYVAWLDGLHISGWSAKWANGNLEVSFKSGGKLWFESYRHRPRPGVNERFHGEDAPPMRWRI